MFRSNRITPIAATDLDMSGQVNTTKALSTVSTLAIVSFASFVAFFDFTIFVFMADIFSVAFFPIQTNTLSMQIQVTVLFALGFALRPVGAWVIGRYGDKYGRKPALTLTMILFLLISLLATVLPSYTQVGLLASILLISVRLLQGVAFAGHLTLGFVYIAEICSKSYIALSVGVNMAAILLGALACAGLVLILESMLSTAQLLSFGWRIMFLVSTTLSFIALMLVRRLKETSLFSHALTLKSTSESKQKPASSSYLTPSNMGIVSSSVIAAEQWGTESVKVNRFNAILLATILSLISSSLITTVAVLLPNLLLLKFIIDADLLYTAHTVGMLGLMVGLMFYGWLNGRIGASKSLMLGAVLLGIVVFVFYYYCMHSDMSQIIPFYGLLGFASGIISICISIMIRLFPIHHRLTTISIIYNSMTASTGVILPFALLYYTNLITLMPALYLLFICICAFIIGYYMSQSPNISELERLPN